MGPDVDENEGLTDQQIFEETWRSKPDSESHVTKRFETSLD